MKKHLFCMYVLYMYSSYEHGIHLLCHSLVGTCEECFLVSPPLQHTRSQQLAHPLFLWNLPTRVE